MSGYIYILEDSSHTYFKRSMLIVQHKNRRGWWGLSGYIYFFDSSVVNIRYYMWFALFIHLLESVSSSHTYFKRRKWVELVRS